MRDRDKQLLALLGQRLRHLRLQRGLTQQNLAERCGLATKYISEIERGLRNPSLVTLQRIAGPGLGTSLAALVFRIDEQRGAAWPLIGDGAWPANSGWQQAAAAGAAGAGRAGEQAAEPREGAVTAAEIVAEIEAAAALLPPVQRERLLGVFRAIGDLIDEESSGSRRRRRRPVERLPGNDDERG